VFLLSTVKFFFGGIPLALGCGFSFFEAVTVTCLGGFTGTLIFIYISEKMILGYKNRKHKLNPTAAPKKIFTKRRRMIIKTKNRFGLLGSDRRETAL